jgi:hypothetical protein
VRSITLAAASVHELQQNPIQARRQFTDFDQFFWFCP